MTLLKVHSEVTCPRTGRPVSINEETDCRYCEFLGPVSMFGKTSLVLACKYGEPKEPEPAPR